MNRLFGSTKKVPKPTLNDAISNVGTLYLQLGYLLRKLNAFYAVD